MSQVVMIGCDLHDGSMLLKIAAAEKLTATKTQIQSLLKRCQVARPAGLGKRWTKTYRAWLLHGLAEPLDPTDSPLGAGARAALSSLVRQMLCQATWVRLRYDPEEKAAFERIRARNPKHKKIAVVASMRRLAIRLWRRGVAAGGPTGAASPVAVRAVPEALSARSRAALTADFLRHDKGVRGRREQELVPGTAASMPGT